MCTNKITYIYIYTHAYILTVAQRPVVVHGKPHQNLIRGHSSERRR